MKRAMLAIILFFLAMGIAAASLDEVEKAIKEKNAGWKAGETTVSRMSKREQKSLLGVIIDEERSEVRKLAPGKNSVKVPRAWDWRDAFGANWVTPVKNQAGCGSCWAFGSIAQLESAFMIARGVPEELDLSEQYLVSCDSGSFGCGGSFMYSAYDFIRDYGVPDESCFPYRAKDLPCSDACADPLMYSSESWKHLPSNERALMAAIYEHPITVTFYVYQDFLYYTGGIYKHVWGKLLGGHAVCVVGWDNQGKSFIAKNSWGSGWGEDGYFRIQRSEMNSDVYFGGYAATFTVSSAAPGKQLSPVTAWAGIKETGAASK